MDIKNSQEDKQPIVENFEVSEAVNTSQNSVPNSQTNQYLNNEPSGGAYIPPNSYMNSSITSGIPQNTSSLTVTKNQPSPAQIKNVQKALRSTKQRLMCPYCRTQVWTEVKTNLNVLNVLCCLCTAFIPWCILKCCQNKDYNCLDAQHKCPNCHSNLADYKAC
jgi:hypothetical protein